MRLAEALPLEPGCIGAFGVKRHLINVKPECCGGNLAEGHVCALAHFGPHAAHIGALNCARAVEFHPGRAAFRRAQAKAHILEAAGHTYAVRNPPTAALRRLKGGQRAIERRARRRCGRVPCAVALHPARLMCGALQHLHGRAAGGQRAARGQRRAVAPKVAHPQLHRVHTQRGGEFVHLHFACEMGLRPAKAAESARWRVVGINGARSHIHIGNRIGAQ